MPVTINGTSGNISASSLTGVDTGKILQVVSTTKTDTTSSSSSSFADISGMAVTITPSSSSNKIYLSGNFCFGINDARYRIYLKITGGNCSNYVGDAATGHECAQIVRLDTNNHANHQQSASLMYLDSPATTSAVTYQVQWKVQDSQTAYLNRDHAGDVDRGNTASTFTAMEVAA
tara:strand:+ start:1188 stop:1712 length:525 start_codon:yes stop_codon:yes gene_type:complete